MNSNPSAPLVHNSIVSLDSNLGHLGPIRYFHKHQLQVPWLNVALRDRGGMGGGSASVLTQEIYDVLVQLHRAGAAGFLMPCNTMTALMAPYENAFTIPLFGTIDPTVKAIVQAAWHPREGAVMLIGTKICVETGAYQGKLARWSCPFVTYNASPLIDHIAHGTVHGIAGQLKDIVEEASRHQPIAAVALICTHFTPFCDELRALLGDIPVVDSGEEFSAALYHNYAPVEHRPRMGTDFTADFLVVRGDPDRFKITLQQAAPELHARCFSSESVLLPRCHNFPTDFSAEVLLEIAKSSTRLADYIEWLHRRGELDRCLPEIAAMTGFEQPPQWHIEDVFQHTLSCLRAADNQDTNVAKAVAQNLAKLFHDTGKPQTFSQDDPDNPSTIHYYKHEAASELLWRDFARRMGFAESLTEAAAYGIRWHMLGHRLETLSDDQISNLRSPHFHVLREVMYCDEKSRGKNWHPARWNAAMQRVERILAGDANPAG